MNEIKKLENLLEDAIRLYKENGGDYEAGRVDGIKWALEILRNENKKM